MDIYEENGLGIARIKIPDSDSNYNYILWCGDTKDCAVIDPIDPIVLLNFIRDNDLMVKYVINTHCHPDHISGNDPIIKVSLTHISKVLVHPEGLERVTTRSSTVDEGDVITVGNQEIKVLHIPGHCPEHIALLAGDFAFVGDTIFIAGCGVTKFRGVIEDLFESIERLKTLPDDTKLLIGHDYAEKNLRFAIDVEPGNEAAKSKLEEVRASISRGEEPAVTTIGEEKTYNPFLRYDVPEIVEELKSRNPELDTSPLGVFTELRSLRDDWT